MSLVGEEGFQGGRVTFGLNRQDLAAMNLVQALDQGQGMARLSGQLEEGALDSHVQSDQGDPSGGDEALANLASKLRLEFLPVRGGAI